MKNNAKRSIGVSCSILVVVALLGIAVSFFAVAGVTWLIMYGLMAIGLALPFAWSWWLAAIVWLVLGLLGSMFTKN